MKPFGEAGILVKDSEYYTNFPSHFAKENLFYTDHGGHYFLNEHYITSRIQSDRNIFSILYLVKGEMIFVIDGEEYTLHDNELCIVDINRACIYAACKESELLFMRFRGNKSAEMVSKIYNYRHAYSPPSISRTYNAISQIVNGFINQTPLYEEIISSHIHSILCDILSLQRKEVSFKDSPIEQAVNFMEANYYLPITIHDLADKAYLNASYFSEKFKSQIGMTPKQYLTNIRLNAAKILLLDTNWSIKEISFKVGFQNDAYFSYYFHKRFKITPTEYRKRI